LYYRDKKVVGVFVPFFVRLADPETGVAWSAPFAAACAGLQTASGDRRSAEAGIANATAANFDVHLTSRRAARCFQARPCGWTSTIIVDAWT
jgi:hypothetical protein